MAKVAEEYDAQTKAIDIAGMSSEIETRLRTSIQDDNLSDFLKIYDNKGFVAIAARHLKSTSQRDFIDWLSRVLRNNSIPGLAASIRAHIPVIAAG